MCMERIHTHDFIRSLFINLPYKDFKVYDKKASEIDHSGKVTFHEYVSFHLIFDHVDDLEDYVKIYKYISKEHFTKFVREQEKKQDGASWIHKINIGDSTIDCLFKVLDIDGNGIVDQSEIMAIFKSGRKLSSGK